MELPIDTEILEDWLGGPVPEYCGDTELGEIDFGAYAANIIDELEVSK